MDIRDLTVFPLCMHVVRVCYPSRRLPPPQQQVANGLLTEEDIRMK